MGKLKQDTEVKPVATENYNLVAKPSYHIESPGKEYHHSKLGVHAFNLWKKDLFTDVTIKCGDILFHAHRPVLSCYSTYFKKNIPKYGNSIHLDGLLITPETFEILLHYMYTGDLKITIQNIGSVYTASSKLGIKKSLKLSTDILMGKIRSHVQCVYLYATAKKLNETDSVKKALETMCRHFEEIIGTSEFLDLTFDQIIEYLSSDHLAVRSEVLVYLAALKWLNTKFFEREAYIEPVMKCVRFPTMTLNEVLACFSPPLLSGIAHIPAVEHMMLTATCYISAKTVDEQVRFERYSCKPRQYLAERLPLILWDTNIFDPIRYSQYKMEIAAITIQSAFRAYIARRKKEKLQHLQHLKDTTTVPKQKTSSAPKSKSSTKNRVEEMEQERNNEITRILRGNNYVIENKSEKGPVIQVVNHAVDSTQNKTIPSFEGDYKREIPVNEKIHLITKSYSDQDLSSKALSGKADVIKSFSKTSQNANVPLIDTSRDVSKLSNEMPLGGVKTPSRISDTLVKKSSKTSRTFLEPQTSFTFLETPSKTMKNIAESQRKKSLTVVKTPSETTRPIIKTPSETTHPIIKTPSETTRTVVEPQCETSLEIKTSVRKIPSDIMIFAPESRKFEKTLSEKSLIIEKTTTDKKYFEDEMSKTEEITNTTETSEYKAMSLEPFFNEEGIEEKPELEEQFDRRIILLGGYNPKKAEDISFGETMTGYNPLTDEWSYFGIMPVSRHNMCAAFSDFSIYIIGGSELSSLTTSGIKPIHDCRKFDLLSRNWKKIRPMCFARMYHSVAVVEDVVYVVGGVDDKNNILNTIEWYSVQYDEWRILGCKLKVPKMSVGICGHEGNLWIAGGMNDENVSGEVVLYKEIEICNLKTKQMEYNVTDLPSARTYITLVECNKKVYCVGGASIVSGESENICSLREMYVYSHDTRTWVSLKPLPIPGHSITAISIGDVIYTINGLSTTVEGMLCQDVNLYDSMGNLWIKRNPLPVVNDGICAVCIPTKLYEAAKVRNSW